MEEEIGAKPASAKPVVRGLRLVGLPGCTSTDLFDDADISDCGNRYRVGVHDDHRPHQPSLVLGQGPYSLEVIL